MALGICPRGTCKGHRHWWELTAAMELDFPIAGAVFYVRRCLSRPKRSSATATMMTRPLTICCQNGETFNRVSPLFRTPMIRQSGQGDPELDGAGALMTKACSGQRCRTRSSSSRTPPFQAPHRHHHRGLRHQAPRLACAATSRDDQCEDSRRSAEQRICVPQPVQRRIPAGVRLPAPRVSAPASPGRLR